MTPRSDRRMKGTGPYAWTIGRRFQLAVKRLGINAEADNAGHRHVPEAAQAGEQLTLI